MLQTEANDTLTEARSSPQAGGSCVNWKRQEKKKEKDKEANATPWAQNIILSLTLSTDQKHTYKRPEIVTQNF